MLGIKEDSGSSDMRNVRSSARDVEKFVIHLKIDKSCRLAKPSHSI